MIYHVPNKDIQYLTLKIDNVIIEKVDEFNFLGLTMDTNLNWKKHSEKICNKCTKMIVILNRFFFFFFIFSNFYVGSMCLVRRLHLGRSCASSSDNPLSDKSFLMLSNHLRFGLPLLLFPGTSIPITLFPTYSSSLLETCPYHFNLLSCIFLDVSPTFVVTLILSFLILSILVTPLIQLNIIISATSNFFSCAFFTAHDSAPYIIDGLTTVLYTFPLILKLILRSHRIPDILFQFFHPDCILFVISASKSPFSANVAPRYLNVCTRSTFSPSILTSEFPSSKSRSTLNLR